MILLPQKNYSHLCKMLTILVISVIQVLDNHVINYVPPEVYCSYPSHKPHHYEKFGLQVVGALSCDPRQVTIFDMWGGHFPQNHAPGRLSMCDYSPMNVYLLINTTCPGTCLWLWCYKFREHWPHWVKLFSVILF